MRGDWCKHDIRSWGKLSYVVIKKTDSGESIKDRAKGRIEEPPFWLRPVLYNQVQRLRTGDGKQPSAL